MAKPGAIDLQNLSQQIASICKTVLLEKYNQTVTDDPQITEREIVEYKSRLRTFGLAKFNGPCYISAINLYDSQASLQAKKPSGAIVFFIDEELAELMLHKQSRSADSENEELVGSATAEFANTVAAKLKDNILGSGFNDLVLADPMNYKNDAPEGIAFKYSEYKMMEISLVIKKKKSVVINFTLGTPG